MPLDLMNSISKDNFRWEKLKLKSFFLNKKLPTTSLKQGGGGGVFTGEPRDVISKLKFVEVKVHICLGGQLRVATVIP